MNLQDVLSPKLHHTAGDSPTTHPMKFIVVSNFGELLDLAIHLSKVEKHSVTFCVLDHQYDKIGDGIVPKTTEWWRYIGKDYIWIVDGCETADLQDWLRKRGENVVGTNREMADVENDRQKGQDLFKKAGFNQPFSQNFTDFESAIQFVKQNKDYRWILKQNGNAPKHLNHAGKFDGGIDMLYHLEEMKKSWNTAEYGEVDFDLMEIVEGLEVAASAFFNGHDFLRNKEGKIVGFLNYEEKKEGDGGLGVTCGEMGTIFKGVDEDDPMFKDIILRPELIKKLKETDYRGVFDINGCLTDEGYVVFEATSRFGIPATPYEFMTGLTVKTGELLYALANGEDLPIDVDRGWGIAQVIVSKPFPTEADVDDSATSRGEKLWILSDGKPVKDFTEDHRKHIHLENFLKDGDYKVATKNGYLLVVTNTGKTIKSVREDTLQYIKENLYIADMKYRQDLGARIEKYEQEKAH